MKRMTYMIAALLICLGASAQEKRMAVVEFSTSYLRLQPDYESPLETQELMGTVVEIVGEKSYWREVVTPQPYRAWCTDQGLVEMNQEELEAYMAAPKVMFMQLYGHIYTKPSLKSATLCDLVGGDIMRFAGRKGRWTKVMLPSGKTGYVPSKELKEHKGFMSIAMGEGNSETISPETTEAIIAEAEKLVGVPYLWGGMSAKGVDCSGLVRISHIMNGILLPRNASQQIKCGDRVELDQLQRGDLVFFGTPATDEKPMRVTHVGIYLGDGRIIHSSHRVRINSLTPGEADYYENAHRLIAAIRL
ncbi:MAG: C40 family peptidase [Bacteroidales bacterium]|nr:C40 family peptidase [Bacteroidales bacterium]